MTGKGKSQVMLFGIKVVETHTRSYPHASVYFSLSLIHSNTHEHTSKSSQLR